MLSHKKVVDLSPLLIPSHEKRRLSIRPFIYEPDKTTMHEVDTMSHIGSHVEAPSHFKPEWDDISTLDVKIFYGECVCVDLRHKGPTEPIVAKDLDSNVREGDIVLLHATKRQEDKLPYISKDAAEWLSLHIRMLGIDDTIALEESVETMASHRFLLGRNIPIMEGLENLDDVSGKRFTFIGLPLKVKGLDSSPIRAIALL